jgi:hypothetical protein
VADLIRSWMRRLKVYDFGELQTIYLQGGGQ